MLFNFSNSDNHISSAYNANKRGVRAEKPSGCYRPHWLINSLWTSDVICRRRSLSTSAQVMACCLTVPSHYLNQCWRIIHEILWHSFEGNVCLNIHDINPQIVCEIYTFQITSGSLRKKNELKCISWCISFVALTETRWHDRITGKHTHLMLYENQAFSKNRISYTLHIKW